MHAANHSRHRCPSSEGDQDHPAQGGPSPRGDRVATSGGGPQQALGGAKAARVSLDLEVHEGARGSRRQGRPVRGVGSRGRLSYSVDANILLYASDRASPRHAAALRFLEERPSDPDIFCLAWPTLLAYMRIATHPRIFAEPLAPAAALDNVEALMRLPRVRAIGESDDFLAVYRDVTSG